MSEAITTLDTANMLSHIEKCEDVNEAVKVLKQVISLKSVLEAQEKFHQYCIKYAILEAHTLIKIVELAPDKEHLPIKGGNSVILKETALWLYGMPEEEREKYINMCGEGFTIDRIYYREVKQKEALEKAVRKAGEARKQLLKDYNECGIVDFSEHKKEIRKIIGYTGGDEGGLALSRDLNEGTRDLLLKQGAVCAGDGLYVNPISGTTDQIERAFLIRYASVVNDINKMASLVAESHVSITASMLEKASSELQRISEDDDEHFSVLGPKSGYCQQEEDLKVLGEPLSVCTRWLIYALVMAGVVISDGTEDALLDDGGRLDRFTVSEDSMDERYGGSER